MGDYEQNMDAFTRRLNLRLARGGRKPGAVMHPLLQSPVHHCPGCGAVANVPALAPGEMAVCTHCRAIVAQRSPQGPPADKMLRANKRKGRH